MKKVTCILGILLVFMLVSSLAGYIPVLASDEPNIDRQCTMCVIGKNLTADGSIIVYHNEELGTDVAERLGIELRQDHEPGEMKDVGWETIPEVPVTYKNIVNHYWPEGYPPGTWAAGINEFGVTLVANAQKSKEDPLPTDTGISYCYLVQVVLERARTAEEAVDIMGEMVDTYGIGGVWAECSYVLADPDEAWYIELSYTHWVARRIGDNELFPITNRYLIRNGL